MGITNVKGTHDILPEESKYYTAIESTLSSIVSLFGYQEIRIPVLEHSELFVRGVGESSDIVRKEMYTFLDKGERSLTLRPEFTAGIARCIVQNKIYATSELPIKVYYCGPAFRYERPQLGRYRQFNQFGVESIGHNSPYNDVEVIIMAYTILQSLGLEDVTLKINSLGDQESRDNYRKALKEYFAKYIDNMCEDCKSRFELNPLRILDCKVEEDQAIAKNAPRINQYLSEASKERFNTVVETLKNMGVKYEIDEQLVRGLDYYNETVFELVYTSKAGHNYGAVGAGGHYGNLIKEVGGPEYPGMGFSFGVERIYDVMKDDGLLRCEDNSLALYVMPLGKENFEYAFNVANTVRLAGYSTDICFDEVKLGNMFKRAEKKNARYAVIIGENEVKEEKIILKNMTTQEQVEVANEDLIYYLDSIFNQLDEDHCCCGGENEGCCCGHDHNEEHHHEHGCCCHHKEEK